MVCCKLLVIAIILFFGEISGQLRVQRHLGTTATTQNGMEEGLTGMSGLNLDDELYSDDDNKVVLDKPETVEIELSRDGELRLEVCSDDCMDLEVIVCFDAASTKYNEKAKGECRGANQCGIKAGFQSEHGKKSMWFMVEAVKTEFTTQTCGQVVMAFPTTQAVSSETSKDVTIDSCEPAKHDGNVVRLYVKQAYTECSIKVLNAKLWYPATTPLPKTALPPSLLSTPASSSNTTESSSSNAETTWWIIGGVLGGFAALLIVGFIGCCVYRRHQQKKSAAEKEQVDRKRRVISPESFSTLDLSPYIQKEDEMPKKEAKKDNTEKKKNQKKVEAAPPPAKVLPSKEGTTEDRPKVEQSKEKAATEIKQVQKEKKAPAAKEDSKKLKKVAKKEVIAVAAPPPPPRRKAPSPKPRTVDATQEETPSLGRSQAAVEEGSLSPSIEKKTPAKKPAPKKAPAKQTRVKNPLLTPPPRSTSRRPRRNRAPKDLPQYGLNTEEWEDFKAQQNNPLGKVVEWNAKSAKSLY